MEEMDQEVTGETKAAGTETLILYHWSQSFASQKVRLVLREKRVPCEEREVFLPLNEHNEPWFMRLNPAGEVPVLVHGAAVISHADSIVSYIEETFAGGWVPRLLPEEGSVYLARVQHYRELIDSLPVDTYTHGCLLHPQLTSRSSMPAFATAHIRNQIINTDVELKKLAREHPELSDAYLGKLRRFKSKLLEQDDLAHLERVLHDLDRVLDQVETELQLRSQDSPTDALSPSHPSDDPREQWLCGPFYSLADVSLAVTLHRLAFLGLSARHWGPSAQRRPRLAAYYERSGRRPAFRAVLGPTGNVLLSVVVPTAARVARRYAAALAARAADARLALAAGIGAALVVVGVVVGVVVVRRRAGGG